MRILVTGAAGGLGRYVARELRMCGHEVLAPARAELDLTDRSVVRAYMFRVKPDGVAHIAALANVDRCTDQPEDATKQNAVATINLVDSVDRAGIKLPLTYMSTNDVFSECAGGPFDEDRIPAPGMPYSWSKYAGECAVLAVGGFAVRANFMTLNCHAKVSFVRYVVNGARSGVNFSCYANVLAAPVHASTLARAITVGMLSGRRGVLHVCSVDAVSRVEQATMICDAYGLPKTGIVSVDLVNRCGRPLDARLVSIRGGTCGSVREEVARMAEEELL